MIWDFLEAAYNGQLRLHSAAELAIGILVSQFIHTNGLLSLRCDLVDEELRYTEGQRLVDHIAMQAKEPTSIFFEDLEIQTKMLEMAQRLHRIQELQYQGMLWLNTERIRHILAQAQDIFGLEFVSDNDIATTYKELYFHPTLEIRPMPKLIDRLRDTTPADYRSEWTQDILNALEPFLDDGTIKLAESCHMMAIETKPFKEPDQSYSSGNAIPGSVSFRRSRIPE